MVINCKVVISRLQEASTKAEGAARALAFFQAMENCPGDVKLENLQVIFEEAAMTFVDGRQYSSTFENALFSAFSKHPNRIHFAKQISQRAWCLTFLLRMKKDKRERLLAWTREVPINATFGEQEMELARRLDKECLLRVCGSFQIGHALFKTIENDQKHFYTELPNVLDTKQYAELLGRCSLDSYILEWVTYLEHFAPNPTFRFSLRNRTGLKLGDLASILNSESLQLGSLREENLDIIAGDVAKFIQEKASDDYSKTMLELIEELALLMCDKLPELFVRSLHRHMPQDESGIGYRIRRIAVRADLELLQDLEVTKLVQILNWFNHEKCQSIIDFIVKHKLLSKANKEGVALVFSAVGCVNFPTLLVWMLDALSRIFIRAFSRF